MMKIITKKRILLIVILLLVGGFGYQFFLPTEKQDKKKLDVVKQEVELLEASTTNEVEDYQEHFQNTDIVGKLSFENTNLSIPVVQGDDNEYYLNHLIDHSKNSLGSVFLDYRNQLSDRKLIIYGHNSENVTTDFHILENYLNKNYYSSHQNLIWETDEKTSTYQIFSVYIARTDYQHVNLKFTQEEYATHLSWLKEQSIYDTGVEVSSYDEILLLQTCYVEEENTYLIVVGKKIA